MALQTVSPIVWPYYNHVGSSARVITLNEATDKAAFVFRVPLTGTIDFVAFRTGTVTTANTLKIGLYTVDGSGNPTATAYGSMVAVTQAAPAASTAYACDLGTGATATKGDIVAAVVEFDSWTDGNLQIQMSNQPTGLGYSNWYDETGAAWAKQIYAPMCAIGYGATPVYYYCGMEAPYSTCTALNYNLDTGTADEYALRLSFPFPCEVTGAWWTGYPAAAGDYEMILYSGVDAIAGMTQAVDGDQNASVATSYPNVIYFDSTAELAANTVYRLSLRPTTTAGLRLLRATYLSNALMGGLSSGIQLYETTRLDQGAWAADVTTTLPVMGLIISKLSDGVGTGGGGLPILGGSIVR